MIWYTFLCGTVFWYKSGISGTAAVPTCRKATSPDSRTMASTKWPALAVVLAVAAVAGVVLVSTQADRVTELASCTPCVMGPQCRAGCLMEGAIRPSRMQALSMVDTKPEHPAMRQHQSLWGKQQEIENVNKRLLQLSPLSQPSELGSVLDEAVKQVVRAEAAEVKLRRQAKLEHGANVEMVFKQLSPSDKELFALRAKEFELALHEADKSIMLAEQVMKPLVKQAGAEHLGKGHKKAVKPTWSSDIGSFLSSVVSDGHGHAWGMKKAASTARLQKKAMLPGVVTDNWTLNKGALNIRPKGDDPALPGVKTHGW